MVCLLLMSSIKCFLNKRKKNCKQIIPVGSFLYDSFISFVKWDVHRNMSLKTKCIFFYYNAWNFEIKIKKKWFHFCHLCVNYKNDRDFVFNANLSSLWFFERIIQKNGSKEMNSLFCSYLFFRCRNKCIFGPNLYDKQTEFIFQTFSYIWLLHANHFAFYAKKKNLKKEVIWIINQHILWRYWGCTKRNEHSIDAQP